MSAILPRPEASTSSEVSTLTNLTALGDGFVKKTGTTTLEADSSFILAGVEEDGYLVFNFGSDLPTKLKVRDSDNQGWTYITFQDGQIIASDTP